MAAIAALARACGGHMTVPSPAGDSVWLIPLRLEELAEYRESVLIEFL
jgi:hypothetical protein